MTRPRVWEPLLLPLMASPGVWAGVRGYGSVRQADNALQELRKATRGDGGAVLPPGRWEFRCRQSVPELPGWEIQARYLAASCAGWITGRGASRYWCDRCGLRADLHAGSPLAGAVRRIVERVVA